MKTRLEEIDELLKENQDEIHWALTNRDPNMWDLIDAKVKLEIEKHDIIKKGNN